MLSCYRIICKSSIVLACLIMTGIFPLPVAYAANDGKTQKTKKNKHASGKKRYLKQVEEILASKPEVEDMDSLQSLEEHLQAETVDDMLDKNIIDLIGTPYRFGGNGDNGIDCSSFVKKVFTSLRIPLPRTAREQYMLGKDVPLNELRKGDLLFFSTYTSYASHVGIYLGNKLMVHASSRDRSVTVSTTDTAYYRSRFLGARRIDNITRQQPLQPEITELMASL
jgi:peptidoglycan DL-endopeptidase LytE